MKRIDLTGLRFGRLVVIKHARSENGKTFWDCVCDCGNRKEAIGNKLRSGLIKSCGCLSRELLENGTRRTHGKSGSRVYRIWNAMLQRCRNKNVERYPVYGGRGITVCKRWMKFENFYEDMGDVPAGKSIDRIDNDLGYFKENCRWASSKEQCANKRKTVKFLFNGEVLTLTEHARVVGIKPHTVYMRLRSGWSIHDALTTSPKKISAKHGLGGPANG